MNGSLSRVLRSVLSLLLALFVVYSSLSVEVCAAVLSDDGSSGSDRSDVPVPYASPTETSEDFTMEETIALIVGSEVTYNVQFVGEDIPQHGTIKPVYMPSANTAYSDYQAFIYFPIPHITEKSIASLNLVFNLPFTIDSLNTLYFAIAPFVLANDSSAVDDLYRDYFFTYQIDNLNNPVGSQVVSSFSTDLYVTSRMVSSVGRVSLYDSSIANFCGGSSGYVYGVRKTNQTFLFGRSGDNSLSNNRAFLSSDFQSITSFGFTWSPQDVSSAVYSSFRGIGFIFSPMSITYASGGGYNPDVTIPDAPDPTDPADPTEPTKGEYSEQLDNIYNKLVEQGTIQQAQNDHIIQQNDNIIDQNGQMIDQNQQIIDGQQQQIENDQKLWDDTFNPSDTELGGLGGDIFSEDVQNQVKEKLGLFTFIDDTLQKLLDVFNEDGGSTSLRFPGLSVTVDGTSHQVIEPYDFDIKEYLQSFDFLVNSIRFVNGFLIILAFLAYLNRLKVRFFGND